MILIKHELKQSAKSFLIWTLSISMFIVVCVFMFPEIEQEMGSASEMFASMGAFSDAFGLNELDMGSLMGFYSVECGSILGIGGAFFAALTGANILSKEEKDHTAEFLMAHPVSRIRIITEKLLAVVSLVLLLNLFIFIISVASMGMIGEEIPWRNLSLLHIANLLMQLEVAGVCFGLSAFLRRGSTGAGLGLAAGLYFLNIVANISEQAEFLNYLTPFAYTDGADILSDGQLNAGIIALGMVYMLVSVGAAYWKYTRKDIHC